MTNRKAFIEVSTSQQLKNSTLNQQKAIEEIEGLFQISDDKLDILMRGVGQEMRNGLNVPETEEKQNDLKMIPSFVAGNLVQYFKTPLFPRKLKHPS